MRKRIAIILITATIGGAAIYFLSRPPAPQSTVPSGPPPPLVPGFPPTYPGASLDANHTDAIEGGWTRTFDYTAKAKSDEIITFYRKSLSDAGLQVMAEGGGAYGGMLRARTKDKKRAVYVDVDAPEEKPQQAPKIVVTVIDSK